MIEGLNVDASAAAAERDEVLRRVRDHAGQVARELAVLQGGDYGRETFETDDGEWTLKYEGGDVEYLRFDPGPGSDVYVVSTKEPADAADLATALADYDAFLEAFASYVDSFEGVLDDVSTEFPEVASTEPIVAERRRVLDRIRSVADAMAAELSRYDGEYGTFSTTVASTRWELKWDGATASYLRVGGEGGVYLLSQYDQPTPEDVRHYADDVGAFVEAFNDHVEELEADLSRVSLSEE